MRNETSLTKHLITNLMILIIFAIPVYIAIKGTEPKEAPKQDLPTLTLTPYRGITSEDDIYGGCKEATQPGIDKTSDAYLWCAINKDVLALEGPQT